jgi:hypothetical protein
MRRTTQFFHHRRIPVCADICRALRVLGVGMLVAASAGSGRSVAQGLNTEEKEIETIRGTVVNSITHEPIGRALVYSMDNRFAMMCDAGGHFEFKIPRAKNEAENGNGSGVVFYAGNGSQYRRTGGPNVLMARKPGFLSDEGAQQVNLPDTAEQEVTIPLVPEGLVVGRVNLPTAEVTENLQVELYRRQIQDGREVWNSAGTVQTRSNGEFRFAELSAGIYKVFTHEEIDRDPMTFNPRGQLYGYPPVYYPSSNDFATASAFRVTAGATVSVNLSPTRREYYPVKLGVLNPPQGAGLQIEVWPQGHPGPGYSLGYNPEEQAIVGILPDGSYTIQAAAFGPKLVSGQINFNVRGGGANGASLNLVPGGSIRVELKQEFTSPETSSQWASVQENGKPVSPSQMILRSMQVTLFPLDESHGGHAFGARRPESPNDDSVQIENVRPGSYRVQVNSPLGYVASVSSGGTDLLHNPLVVPLGGTSSPIEITLRDDGGVLEGTIENWQTETPGRKINQPGQRPSSVYLLSTTASGAQPLIGWVSQDGSFSVQQIPPGTYRAIAFDRQPLELEFTNEEAMKKYEAKSQVIEFGAGERKQLRLPLNSASDRE